MIETKSKATIVISSDTNINEYLKRLYHYRRIIQSFTLRDIKIKYARTYFGILWSAIQALVGVGIITFFFDYLIGIDTGNIPYFLYVFPGMASWYFFSYIVGYAGSTLVQSQYLIQKVYFPKLVLPLSQALVGFIDFTIWIVLCLICVLFVGIPISFRLVLLPVFMILNLLAGLSIAIWLSALTIRFRDLQIIIPYIIGFGIFVTPVFYPEILIPSKYSFMLYFNPMAGVITGLRWCILGTEVPSINYLFGFLPVIILFLTGIFYFIKIEYQIVDRL